MEQQKFKTKCPECGNEQYANKTDLRSIIKCVHCGRKMMAYPNPPLPVRNPILEPAHSRQLTVMWIAIIIVVFVGLYVIFNAPFSYAYFYLVAFLTWMIAAGIIINIRTLDKARKNKKKPISN